MSRSIYETFMLYNSAQTAIAAGIAVSAYYAYWTVLREAVESLDMVPVRFSTKFSSYVDFQKQMTKLVRLAGDYAGDTLDSMLEYNRMYGLQLDRLRVTVAGDEEDEALQESQRLDNFSRMGLIRGDPCCIQELMNPAAGTPDPFRIPLGHALFWHHLAPLTSRHVFRNPILSRIYTWRDIIGKGGYGSVFQLVWETKNVKYVAKTVFPVTYQGDEDGNFPDLTGIDKRYIMSIRGEVAVHLAIENIRRTHPTLVQNFVKMHDFALVRAANPASANNSNVTDSTLIILARLDTTVHVDLHKNMQPSAYKPQRRRDGQDLVRYVVSSTLQLMSAFWKLERAGIRLDFVDPHAGNIYLQGTSATETECVFPSFPEATGIAKARVVKVPTEWLRNSYIVIADYGMTKLTFAAKRGRLYAPQEIDGFLNRRTASAPAYIVNVVLRFLKSVGPHFRAAEDKTAKMFEDAFYAIRALYEKHNVVPPDGKPVTVFNQETKLARDEQHFQPVLDGVFLVFRELLAANGDSLDFEKEATVLWPQTSDGAMILPRVNGKVLA
jgi:hypothetical protein